MFQTTNQRCFWTPPDVLKTAPEQRHVVTCLEDEGLIVDPRVATNRLVATRTNQACTPTKNDGVCASQILDLPMRKESI